MITDSNLNKVYTLIIPFEDNVHQILNGKIFKIRRDPEGDHMVFTDPITQDPILTSTSVRDRKDYDNGISVISTVSGTVYTIQRLSYLIPTIPAHVPAEPVDPTTAFRKHIQELRESNEKIMTESLAMKQREIEAAGDDGSDLVAIAEKEDWQHANYCDAWYQITYKFDHDITEIQFRNFLKAHGKKIIEKGAWYAKYTKIFGNGTEWTWREITPYTD